jgi:hypothetical protein
VETLRPQFATTSAKARRNSRLCRALQRRSDQKFTEPVALSSTFPVNLRLPPIALGSGFDLLAPRARCQKNVSGWTGAIKRGRGAKTALFARRTWGNPVDSLRSAAPARPEGPRPVPGTGRELRQTLHRCARRAPSGEQLGVEPGEPEVATPMLEPARGGTPISRSQQPRRTFQMVTRHNMDYRACRRNHEIGGFNPSAYG